MAALLIAAAGVAALIGFGGHGGGGAGSAATARARGSQSSTGNARVAAAWLRCRRDAGFVESFAFDPRNPRDRLRHDQRRPANATEDCLQDNRRRRALARDGNERLAGRAAGTDRRSTASGNAVCGYPGRRLQDGRRRPQLAALASRADHASSFRTRKGMGDRARGRPRQHEHRLCRLRPRQQEHRRRPQLEDRVPAAPHAATQPRHVSALAIAPTRPETIYAITGDFGPSSSTPADGRTTIYKSTDAGTTWQATTVVRGNVAPTALAVDPRHPTTVYAAIGANVLKTTNAGETWQPIADGLPIAAHPRNLSLPLPRGRHGAGGRPTPQRHRLRSPDPGRHLQDQQRRTKPGSAPLRRPLLYLPNGRGRPRTPGNDLRRRPKRNRGRAPRFSEAPTAATPGPRPHRGRC